MATVSSASALLRIGLSSRACFTHEQLSGFHRKFPGEFAPTGFIYFYAGGRVDIEAR